MCVSENGLFPIPISPFIRVSPPPSSVTLRPLITPPAQVHFHVQGRGLDGTIRRAAHIMLLESLPFLRHFAAVARPYLE